MLPLIIQCLALESEIHCNKICGLCPGAPCIKKTALMKARFSKNSYYCCQPFIQDHRCLTQAPLIGCNLIYSGWTFFQSLLHVACLQRKYFVTSSCTFMGKFSEPFKENSKHLDVDEPLSYFFKAIKAVFFFFLQKWLSVHFEC